MNTNTNVYRFTSLDAHKYEGHHVRTTDNTGGVVTRAFPSGDGTRIILYVSNPSGYEFRTDTEHATITK